MKTRRDTVELPQPIYVERLCEQIGQCSEACIDFFRVVHELQDFLHYTRPEGGLTSNKLSHMVSDLYKDSADVMTGWADLDRMLVFLGHLEPRDKEPS